jgi:hypothetical protein
MKKLSILILILFSVAANAAELGDHELNQWAQQKRQTLFKSCDTVTRVQWLKRYERIENDFIAQIETIEKDKSFKLNAELEFWDLGTVVYPQDLPDLYPMRGIYFSCLDFFHQYRDAKTERSSGRALDRLGSCFRRNFRDEKPAIVDDYLGCLSKLKY